MNDQPKERLTKLFWIDLEMTGLDVMKERIIEVAAIVTDFELNELDTFEAPITQDAVYFKNMDDWNQRAHRDSGLLDLIKRQGQSQDLVENKLCHLLDKHYAPNERPVLAGNSIAQDRLFIDFQLHKFSKRLHYRMLDVTSWKIWFKERHQIEYKKQNKHRALDDIRESIAEFRHYLGYVKVNKG